MTNWKRKALQAKHKKEKGRKQSILAVRLAEIWSKDKLADPLKNARWAYTSSNHRVRRITGY